MRVQPEVVRGPDPAPRPRVLRDAFGRELKYLRLSVTERCNFRCTYCLPQGCPRSTDAQPLTAAELARLVRGFAGLGMWKVRLTGGEPTLRQDILEIVERVVAIRGVRRVGLTTNGYRLAAIAPALAAAGLHSVNVSLDSVDPARFESITGSSRLEDVVAGVEAAIAAGIPAVKVNAVLLAGMDGPELDQFLSWTRELPLTVRFIGLMRTAGNAALFDRTPMTAGDIERELKNRGWQKLERTDGDGPATTYGRPDHAGRAGVIAPYSKGFCDSCNRLRVSAAGRLRLCLFGDAEVPLRHLLGSDLCRGELEETIVSAVTGKPASHQLADGRCGDLHSLASIGG